MHSWEVLGIYDKGSSGAFYVRHPACSGISQLGRAGMTNRTASTGAPRSVTPAGPSAVLTGVVGEDYSADKDVSE